MSDSKPFRDSIVLRAESLHDEYVQAQRTGDFYVLAARAVEMKGLLIRFEFDRPTIVSKMVYGFFALYHIFTEELTGPNKASTRDSIRDFAERLEIIRKENIGPEPRMEYHFLEYLLWDLIEDEARAKDCLTEAVKISCYSDDLKHAFTILVDIVSDKKGTLDKHPGNTARVCSSAFDSENMKTDMALKLLGRYMSASAAERERNRYWRALIEDLMD